MTNSNPPLLNWIINVSSANKTAIPSKPNTKIYRGKDHGQIKFDAKSIDKTFKAIGAFGNLIAIIALLVIFWPAAIVYTILVALATRK